MFNFNAHIANDPIQFQQLSWGDSLLTIYKCGLTERLVDLWSDKNYIVYIEKGRKIWHTPKASFDLQEGSCVFVRKGGSIIEQFFDADFCLYIFFVSDTFICDVLKTKKAALQISQKAFNAVIPIEESKNVHSFFKSMLPFFQSPNPPEPTLLELKFRELILTLADNPGNKELLCYFCNLLHAPKTLTLQQIMDDNFCYNLKMEDFARLSYRSLSAFKRDFVQLYNTTPGKWLLEKRLEYSKHLITQMGRSVGDAAFESGFENASHFSRAFRKKYGVSPSSLIRDLAI